MMTGKGVMQNGITVIDEYGMNLDTLQVRGKIPLGGAINVKIELP